MGSTSASLLLQQSIRDLFESGAAYADHVTEEMEEVARAFAILFSAMTRSQVSVNPVKLALFFRHGCTIVRPEPKRKGLQDKGRQDAD